MTVYFDISVLKRIFRDVLLILMVSVLTGHPGALAAEGFKHGEVWDMILDVLHIPKIHAAQSPGAASGDGIATKGNAVLRDGKPFVARGVIFEGFIEPASWLNDCVNAKPARWEYCNRHLESRDYYYGRGAYVGKDALTLAVSDWKVNTIRFNLNQAALDPMSPWYDTQYVAEVKDLIAAARKRDLVVFVALFSAANKNTPDMLRDRYPSQPLATETTRRAALQLGKMFGNDGDVVIELLNEPWPPTNRRNGWKLWLEGGALNNPKSPFNGTTFVGVERIIAELRAGSAKNAIVVQGLEMSFEGMPRDVQDPLNKVIYSVHPFFREDRQGPVLWDRKFGDFSRTHPFIITAWNAKTGDGWCTTSGIDTPTRFVQYVAGKDLGLIGYSFDTPQSMTRDFRKYYAEAAPMGDKCSRWGRAGVVIQKYLRNEPVAAPAGAQ